MQGVQAAELTIDRQRGRMLDQILIDLDDAKRLPLLPDGACSRLTGREGDSTRGLNEADTTDKPAVGVVHRVANEVATRLSDIALYKRACVEIEIQRSASRSDSTSEEALRRDFTRRGARLGRVREGTTTRPSATSSRS
jgi:hypothetical protein